MQWFTDLLPLLGKGLEGVDDEAGGGAVEEVDGGRAHPRLQVVDGHGDVLRVGLVEHPDLAICRGPRHAVPVVVEQHPLRLHRKLALPSARQQWKY